jgi:hypothetical protein
MRVKIRQMLATFANRIQKVLEDANIKLGWVASDVLGVSGRHMLHALVEGQHDPEQLAALAQGRLREKGAELQLALEGQVTDHHRFQLKFLPEFVQFGEKQLSQLEAEIRCLLAQVEPAPVPPEVSGSGRWQETVGSLPECGQSERHERPERAKHWRLVWRVMSGGAGADHHHVVMRCRTICSVHRPYSPVEADTSEKQ